MALITYLMRIMSKKNDAKRDAGLVYPDDILRYENIAYGCHKMNLLDVYRPKEVTGKLPVIVSVHGGGWVYGDKELYSHYCVDLAKRGFVVVNFTYRLSPENRYPCHLEDTANVFRWVLKHGEKYEMDLDNVFAVGDSAGGHLLSLFCSMCTNSEFANKLNFYAPENFVPKAIALNCSVLDVDAAKGGMAKQTMQLMKDVLPKKEMDKWIALANPIAYVNEKYPPCVIMTCNDDFLKDQPITFMKKLDELKVKYEYKFYGDDDNKLGHVFHLDMRNEIGRRCNDEECEFFQKYRKGLG